MSKGTPVPITGSVLQWAMAEAGLAAEDVAHRLKVEPNTVQGWIVGSYHPNKTQFEALTTLLKRPSAIFFMPAPPATDPARANYRRTMGSEERDLKPEESRWIRTARRMQEVTSWLLKQQGALPIELPAWSLDNNPEKVAGLERARIGVSVNDQVRWRDEFVAFRNWRATLENLGILSFRFEIGAGACRGFSLWDDQAPLIAVNTSGYNPASRAYTMLHEYAHLLLRTGAVCVDYSPRKGGDRLERWCETFAAAFLLPRDHVRKYVEQKFPIPRSGYRIVDFEDVRKVAGHYKVSLRAAALRLIELGLAPASLYASVDRLAIASTKKSSQGGSMTKSQRRLQEYGHRVPSILLDGLHNDLLGLHDVLDYMDMDYKQLDDLTSMLAVG